MATITAAGTVARLAHCHSKSTTTTSSKVILSSFSLTLPSSATHFLTHPTRDYFTVPAGQEYVASTLTSITGDVGHGKTTLNAALSIAVETFGKSYETAEQQWYTYKPHNTLVDHPMQSDYVKNMISGVLVMAGAILVVCAVEGPTRLTEEQIWLAKLGGVPKMVVFLNKQDQLLVDGDYDRLLAVELEVRELLSSYEFPGDEIPFVAGSALLALEALKNKDDEAKKIIKRGENQWVDKIYKLMDEIHNYIPIPSYDELLSKKNDLPFLMPVGLVRSQGDMVEAYGTIERGSIQPYDYVELVSLSDTRKKNFVVLGMEDDLGDTLESIKEAGDQVELLLRDVHDPINDIHWGMVLAKHGTITFHRKFTAMVYVFKPKEGGRRCSICLHNMKMLFYMAASEVNWVMNNNMSYTHSSEDKMRRYDDRSMDRGCMYIDLSAVTGKVNSIMDCDMVKPGQHAKMEIELITPVACAQGMRFVIRAIDEWVEDVGVGVILNFIE